MAIINIGGDPSSRLKLGYTLDDLEKNEEFQNVAERFLGSLGEKNNDVFEYLRDSDFNLFSGFQRMSQSEKFTEQQKQDYKYLRSRFDRADMGSFKQYAELIKDATVDIATDPTAIAAMLLTPVTGGTSLAARTAGAKSITNGMKNIALSADKAKGISPAGTVGITAAEVGAWTGLDNHFRQNTELNADMRRIYSTPELVSSTAIGALTGGIFGGLARKNDFFAERMAKLYTNDGYRKDAGSDLVYNLRKAKDKLLAKTLASPAWILKTDADFSKTARELGVRFTPEFGKKLTRQTRRRVGYSYAEDVNFDRGNYKLLFDNTIAPIRKTGEVLPDDSKAVLTLLRGGEVTNASKAVRETADNLREFFNKVLNDAEQVGLEPNRVENYFPRSWDREAIEANPDKFRQLLTKTRKDAEGKEFQIVKPKDVDEVVEGMLNKQNELYSSSSTLITQARKFRNLDDNEFSEFLNNDLVPVVTDYFMGAARTINHKKHFLSLGKDVSARRTEKGNLMLFKQSNEQQFINRFIKPIDDELKAARGKGLTKNQKKDILKVYESVTGQVDYFDSGVIQGIYDGTKLANALAYLPLATLSSLSEAFITLGKAPTSSAIKGMQSTIDNGHNFFTKEFGQLIKEKHQMTDSELVKEMNSVFLAVDESLADVTNRLAGEGLQNETLKRIARGYYRLNVLIPWTKTVQLAAFSTGKDMITQNLAKLASPAELSSRATQRLRGELNDLGVDIDKGLAWHNKHNGKFNKASLNDEFYKNDIVRGAGRFTNSVILQTSREYATVPTFMTNPKWDILTQFLRYPTVFSNTVLRNFAKETITDTRANAPKLAAFVVMATNLAKATNYWRSSPEERERIDTEGRDYLDTMKAFQRVGLLGPLEHVVRIGEAISYGQNPIAATGAVGGPIINDIIGLTLYNRGLLETAARKAPLIGTRNIFDRAVGDIMEEYTGFREPYTPLQKAAKEADKAIGGGFERGLVSLLQREEEDVDNITDRRILKNTGGLVSSRDLYTGQPLDVNVQYTKEDPADRINPMTGEPYQEQMSRLGFAIGGIVSKVAQQLTKSQKKNLVDGDYVYHFTSKANAEKIKKEGLNPLKTSNFVKAGTGERYQASPAVYAFKNPADAVAFARKTMGKKFDNLALVKIKKSNYRWEADQAPDIESLFNDKGIKELGVEFNKREVKDLTTGLLVDMRKEYLPSLMFKGAINSKDIIGVKDMKDIQKAFKDPKEFFLYSKHNERFGREGNPYGFAKIIADVFENKRKKFNQGGNITRYNNPGNIERGQGYAGETGQFYAEDRERPFVVFDTPEAGMRAIVRDMNTKLNRYSSFKDEAIDYALLEYLGGGRTGTKEERLKRAEIENPDTVGYLKEGSSLYKQKGMEGLLRAIINRENNPENAAFYNDDNLIKRALKISEKDFPTGTTSEEMFKLLNN
jgi:hypothetical protein